jgi:branched-chain amino acid transport system permease protein
VFSAYTESLLIIAGINIILSLSFYLPQSAGMVSMAQGGFMAIGAFVSAGLTVKLGVPFYPALLIGGIIAGVVGVIVGFPALRIKGIYLLLLTLGISEIIRIFFLNFKYTGGVAGLGGIQLHTNLWNVYLVVVLLGYLFHRIAPTRMGRALAAIREDEEAAEITGINLTRTKLQVFGAGAAMAGIAGGFYSHFTLYITSDNFGVAKSIEILLPVLIGGIEIFWGPILGSLIVTFIPEWLRVIQPYRMMVFGIIVVVMMILRPQGLLDRSVIRSLLFHIRRLCGFRAVKKIDKKD